MSKKLLTSVLVAAVLGATFAAGSAQAKPWGPKPWWPHPHHHHHHHGWGGPLALGLMGATAIGMAAAASDDCYYVRRRVYDSWGNFIGYRNVPTC